MWCKQHATVGRMSILAPGSLSGRKATPVTLLCLLSPRSFTSDTGCVWFPHIKQSAGRQAVLQPHSVLTPSTTRWRQTPQVKAPSNKTAQPAEADRCQSDPGCHLCVGPTGCKLKAPTPPWGLVNLQEWLIELRKTFYSQDHWLS